MYYKREDKSQSISNISLARILHAVPEGGSVDVYLDGLPFYKNILFTQFSPYIYVPEGEYEITVYNQNTKENPLVIQNIKTNSNELVTVAITGNIDDIELLEIPEKITFPQPGNALGRYVNLSPNLPEVDIILDEEIIFEEVGFREYTEYKEIEEGEYKVDLVSSKDDRVIKKNLVDFTDGRIYTFYTLGNLPNIQTIKSLDGASYLQ